MISTFKEAIKCNFVRDKDRIFKYVYRSKRTEYKLKTEYTEITYKNLKNVINNEYLSDNIGTYYMCLLQEREYLYKKESKHCLFLNSIQFHKVKYPSNEKDHDEVKKYLLQRYAVPGEKLFSKDCELYILNNSNATHYICYRVRWCNKGKSSGWVFEEYDSMKHTNKELSIPTPNAKGFKGIWKFLNILLE